MHVNISRDSFEPWRQYLRVVQGQGGVLLDADGNEQAAILLHQLHTLAADLFGPTWGPAEIPAGSPKAGFAISLATGNSDLKISPGRYYVGGLPAYAEKEFSYLSQPNPPATAAGPKSLTAFPLGAYLDVWERHLTELEGALRDPRFRDPGLEQLGGSTRTQLVWQVRLQQLTSTVTSSVPDTLKDLAGKLRDYLKAPTGAKPTLRARPVTPPPASPTPGQAQCPASAAAGYTGLENQLYRVEVHSGGAVFAPGDKGTENKATFKWSRDNGAVTYAIESLTGKGSQGLHVTLKSAGLDDYSRLRVGDWVEYLDEAITLNYNALDDNAPAGPDRALPLLVVTKTDPLDPTTVELSARSAAAGGLPTAAGTGAFLRRWDQRPPAKSPAQPPTKGTPGQSTADNALLAVATPDDPSDPDAGWLQLEQGVMIKFAAGTANLQRGDYWLIPARVATAAVLWPLDDSQQPKPLLPRGLNHHYAPLWVFKDEGNYLDCRNVLDKDKVGALFITPTPVTH